MNIYFQPINIDKWNIFEKVKGVGHTEAFLATKMMTIGDMMLLHVGHHNNAYESGVYAVGEIISEPFILRNHPDDYCNNKNSVYVKITKIDYSTPFITHDKCKEFVSMFRRVHRLDKWHYDKILEILSSLQNDSEIIEEIERDAEKLQIQGKEKLAFVKTRVNQGVFRDRLLKRYKCCCLCKVERTELLVASHIKPWSESSEYEKLDTENGLLLCPNHDALFDRGFISFGDSGSILISNALTKYDRLLMNVDENMKVELTSKNKAYMSYHRKNIFKLCDLKAIKRFALTWRDKFEDENTNTHELENQQFANQCMSLGFILDKGHEFFDIYGENVKEYGEFEKIIESIDNVHLLGSAILYRWRYITHWSCEPITEQKIRKWFVVALDRMGCIADELVDR